MKLSSCDSITHGSTNDSVCEWAVSSGAHGKGMILEFDLVERVVLISGARWLWCDAVDTVLPSLYAVLSI